MLLKKLTICIISILFGIILCVSLSMDHNGITYENKFDTEQHKDSKNYDIKYKLNEILSMLLYTRILYPGSKLSSLEDAGR